MAGCNHIRGIYGLKGETFTHYSLQRVMKDKYSCLIRFKVPGQCRRVVSTAIFVCPGLASWTSTKHPYSVTLASRSQPSSDGIGQSRFIEDFVEIHVKS